jgi:hypothetical protein
MQKSIILLILMEISVSWATAQDISFISTFDVQLNRSIKSYGSFNFTGLQGFGTYKDNKGIVTYYALDYAMNGRIVTFDENWNFISYRDWYYPAYMKQIGSDLYISNNFYNCKVDKNLTIITIFNNNETYALNRGICYNPQNNTILIADNVNNRINVFDRNLNFKNYIDTRPYSPFSIEFFNGYYYVGTQLGELLIIRNNKIETIKTKCNSYITSLMFDKDGKLAILCDVGSMVYIYSSAGIYLEKSIPTISNPTDMEIDTKNRLVIYGKKEIAIYNSFI